MVRFGLDYPDSVKMILLNNGVPSSSQFALISIPPPYILTLKGPVRKNLYRVDRHHSPTRVTPRIDFRVIFRPN